MVTEDTGTSAAKQAQEEAEPSLLPLWAAVICLSVPAGEGCCPLVSLFPIYTATSLSP